MQLKQMTLTTTWYRHFKM